MVRNGGGAAQCKHGDKASVTKRLPEHPIGSVAACSARNKNAEDPVLSGCERSRLEHCAHAIETATSPRPRLYVSAEEMFPITTYH